MGNDLQIVTNDEEISFYQYMKRLYEIYRDCNREVYYSEILMPLFKMCCPEGIKIVPIYDDRHTGRSDNFESDKKEKSDAQKRMETICAKEEDGKYIVPDFIFVPESYAFDKPVEPIMMAETKKPVFLRNGRYYQGLEAYINDRTKPQLVAEAKACGGKLIFTDGITWMILRINSDGMINHEIAPICFVKKYEGYYKTQRIETKYDEIKLDPQIFEQDGEAVVKTEPKEWKMLRNELRNLISSRFTRNRNK